MIFQHHKRKMEIVVCDIYKFDHIVNDVTIHTTSSIFCNSNLSTKKNYEKKKCESRPPHPPPLDSPLEKKFHAAV